MKWNTLKEGIAKRNHENSRFKNWCVFLVFERQLEKKAKLCRATIWMIEWFHQHCTSIVRIMFWFKTTSYRITDNCKLRLMAVHKIRLQINSYWFEDLMVVPNLHRLDSKSQERGAALCTYFIPLDYNSIRHHTISSSIIIFVILLHKHI